ncbi:MAG TPA: NUDIX domain-containing protein [Solirubrobacteraceae bacterium]|nr:NUDIX domain-containing protein [Solirubrobacteraceae bacterium]
MSSELRGGEVLRELSYGGVVVREDPASGQVEMVVIVPRGKRRLALPKGGANADETPELTAAREVREETGVTGALRGELGDVTYWYRRSGRRVRKTVRFFLFDYVEGSTDDHDHEVDEARWIPLDEARTALSFPGEREMAARAARLLTDPAADR